MKFVVTALLTLVGAALLACSGGSSGRDSSEIEVLSSKLDEVLATYEALVAEEPWRDGCSGLVSVAEAGEELYTAVVGMAKDRAGAPVAADSRFLIGSITKQFTAALVLKRVQDGKLNLHESISSYLPEYPAGNANSITLHHLLSHTSGIPNYTALPEVRLDDPRVYTPEEILGLFSRLALDFSPGDRFEYSNSNYVVLGLILERTSGQSFAQLLEQHIFQPAGMRDSGYDPKLDFGTLVPGHVRHGSTVKAAPPAGVSLAYAAGGMYSTASDLIRWEHALSENRILSEEFTQLLFQKHVSAGGAFSYGYGWLVGETLLAGAYAPIHSHGGAITGFTSWILRVPDKEGAIFILCNVLPVDVVPLGEAIRWALYG